MKKKSNIHTSVLFVSSFRIVPITGVSQLGWPTISTTLFIHLHVSQPAHTHVHINTQSFFSTFCSLSTPAYLSSQRMENCKSTMH